MARYRMILNIRRLRWEHNLEKAVSSDPDKAGAFFRHHLPPDVVSRVEWSTLAVLPSSFVKRDLQQNHSDLLFPVRLGGRESLL